MHTRITPENPHGHNRYGFAWENVSHGTDAHLDFGCYDGAFLASLRSKEAVRLVGVDRNREAVRKAQEQFPDLQLIHISRTVPLPFGDGEFSSVSALDVIEHVDDQIALLHELSRVLKDGGALIVTVPGQHLFSFMDIGNLKFRFPKLHRWHYCRKHSPAEYESRYVSNPNGLVGDISAKKRWHEHFSRAKLERLLKSCGFTVIDFGGAGFFSRPLKSINLLLAPLRPIRAALAKVEALDARLFESAHLFCVAKKR
ncbi:MAG: class I SAM-dependent methyltransferase [Phycisphaerales bacterium]|nr:MAG: class I SAM-dependent methyltransferase [Phycisphaerales bacterium]